MRSSRLVALAVPVAVFGVYLVTLYPTVGWVDCGEIAAGCYMLNVLHPTGYPLYTLIGFLFSHLPLGTVVARVNALSALFSALAAMFCFLAVLRLTRSQVAGLVTAALYAFSLTVWSNSVDADVFGLTALYVSLTVYLLLPASGGRQQNLLLVAYVLGLALTNHMSFASTFVGALVCVILVYRRELFRVHVLTALVAFFLLGLTPYLYLLIRSQTWPLFNWGNAHNLERLIWHVTGKQYQVWMFSLPFSEILGNLGRALGMLAQELYFVLIPVLLWGMWLLWKKRREIFWLLGVIFLLNILYAANYSIPDIQSYYVPFMIAAFIFTGVGLAEVMKRLRKVPSYVFLLLVLIPPAINFRRAGAQGNYISEDFGRNYLKSMPENALVMTANWDMYSPIFYLRYIQKERPDVCVIDKELLRRSWYVQGLRYEYPWLYERSRSEIEAYLRYNDEFEHNTLRDPAGIQNAFVAMINSFVTKNPERRSFLTFDDRSDADAKSILPARKRIPFGLLYELEIGDTMPHRVPISFDYAQFIIRRPNLELDYRTKVNMSTYERLATERAAYLLQMERRDEARATLDWVLKEFPGSAAATNLRSRLQTHDE